MEIGPIAPYYRQSSSLRSVKIHSRPAPRTPGASTLTVPLRSVTSSVSTAMPGLIGSLRDTLCTPASIRELSTQEDRPLSRPSRDHGDLDAVPAYCGNPGS